MSGKRQNLSLTETMSLSTDPAPTLHDATDQQLLREVNKRGIQTPFGPMWVMQVPVLSTSHIHQTDSDRYLEEQDFAAEVSEGEGHILSWSSVATPEELAQQFQDYSPALRHIVATLHEAGFSYVRFDNMGDTVPILPTFEW